MKRKRAAAILELICIDLSEGWRFPIPELLSFLYTLFPLLFSYLIRSLAIEPPEAKLLLAVSVSQGTISLITMLLVLKNISYGLANEVKKGLIQTYLSYPIKRSSLLLTKIVTGILIPILYVVASTMLFAYINFPGLLFRRGIVLLLGLGSLIGRLSLMSGLLLLVAVTVRGGGTSLGLGIALLFGMDVLSMSLNMLGGMTGERLYWDAYYLLNPLEALVIHYGSPHFIYFGYANAFKPGFLTCIIYLSSHYLIVVLVYVLTFIYFTRRFEP